MFVCATCLLWLPPSSVDVQKSCTLELVKPSAAVVQREAALDHLKSAVRLNPSEAKYRHTLGKAYEAAEQWQAALAHYQYAVDKDPFTTAYQLSMVKPLMRLKRLVRVVEVGSSCTLTSSSDTLACSTGTL